MTALALLQQLYELGCGPDTVSRGTLRYKAPKGTMTPALLDGMRQHKAALHDLVEAFEERAAIAEYCGGLTRAAAEREAWSLLEACYGREKVASFLLWIPLVSRWPTVPQVGNAYPVVRVAGMSAGRMVTSGDVSDVGHRRSKGGPNDGEARNARTTT